MVMRVLVSPTSKAHVGFLRSLRCILIGSAWRPLASQRRRKCWPVVEGLASVLAGALDSDFFPPLPIHSQLSVFLLCVFGRLMGLSEPNFFFLLRRSGNRLILPFF